MIIIPLTKNFSWRRPPLLTIGLIVINCFIFTFFQQNDDRYWHEAMKFYFDSGLGAMEMALYREDKQGAAPVSAKDDPSLQDQSEEEQRFDVFDEIVGNAEFSRRMDAGSIIPETDPRLREWRRLRAEFESKLDRVVAYKYGFRPAYPRVLTSVSSMFLHGGWGHLIGNMIFLWLIGALIEYGCRHGVFLVLYLLGGLGGDVLFWLLNSNSAMPCVGASGAISGIMGAFTVLYGLKRVNIFLNLGFYFNYVKFPALLLLPFWMGHELFQLHFDELSNVGYAAHLGGLGAGALLAYLAKRVPGSLDSDAFVAAEEDKVGPLLEKALGHMGALEFDQARLLLEKALESDPDNLKVWQHLYTIDRQNPQAPQFHRTTARLMDLLCLQPEHAARACTLFEEYTRIAKPPRLSAGHYIRISRCFIASGDLATARRILWTLVKKARHLDELPMAVFRLAQGFQQKEQTGDYLECLRMIETHFPMSGVARVAGEQLKKGSNPL